MNLITCLVVALTIFSSMDRIFSAVFFELKKELTAGDYFRSKSASVHRGLALSYSPFQKNQMCQDVFYAQLYVIPELIKRESEVDITFWINDGQITDGEPQHSTSVEKVETLGQDQSIADLREIFYLCVGNFNLREPFLTNTYFISNAYRSGWWYGNIVEKDKRIYSAQRFLISLSPAHVPLEQEKLEQQYLNIRQTIDALQKESPAYVQFMEERDPLLSLSVFRKMFLCASILSSPTYREERLEFSLEWMQENSFEISLGYETRHLSFTEVVADKLPFEGYNCEGFVDGDVRNSHSTSLFITQAYDDKHSVYVVEKRDEHYFLSKYFRKVPLLINVNEPIDEGSLSKNYGT